MINDHAKEYIEELKKSLDNLPMDKIEEITRQIKEAGLCGKHIFVMGNGGSSATASHFVCDLAKGSSSKNIYRAVCMTDNVPMLTAWANDTSYAEAFAKQLEAMVEKDDLVIAFTGSGNSKNVLQAIEYANKKGAKTIAFTGFDGGKIKHLAKTCLIVPSDNMERIEDIHLALCHIIHLYLLI
ncbi:MAG: SIS domain-containing protein [Candidatus Margulisiibacteriota bacterium]